eukprot:scaffold112603_cov20-Prasinocladus_malaysianus.AAC.1
MTGRAAGCLLHRCRGREGYRGRQGAGCQAGGRRHPGGRRVGVRGQHPQGGRGRQRHPRRAEGQTARPDRHTDGQGMYVKLKPNHPCPDDVQSPSSWQCGLPEPWLSLQQFNGHPEIRLHILLDPIKGPFLLLA